MTWELANHAKGDGILARFGGKVKARHDAMMHLHRVTDTLVPAIDGMNLLIDWWSVLLNAAGVLAEAATRVKNIAAFQSNARIGLGQITGGLELYQEVMREPMHSFRAKWKEHS